MKILQTFKGGSLSSTKLVEIDGEYRVRKYVDRIDNRELGLVRLFSQKTRLQQLRRCLGDSAVDVLDVGSEGRQAYLELEYLEDYLPLPEFIDDPANTESDMDALAVAISSIWRKLANETYSSSVTLNSLNLFFEEEVFSRAMEVENSLLQNESRKSLNGAMSTSLTSKHDELQNVLRRFDGLLPQESMCHGNMTLENIMIRKSDGKIVLIDPYDENYFHSYLMDISTIFQDSKYLYFLLNSKTPVISDGYVSHKARPSSNMLYFNSRLELLVDEICGNDLRDLITLLTGSAFIRMAPFKISLGRPDLALSFYLLGNTIFDSVLEKSHAK